MSLFAFWCGAPEESVPHESLAREEEQAEEKLVEAQPIFTVTLTKPSEKAGLGLELDNTAGAEILICSVNEGGPIWYYNKYVAEEFRVKAGDFLISVNGVKGDIEKLVEEVHRVVAPELKIARPQVWEVVFNKVEEESLGLGLGVVPKTTSLTKKKKVSTERPKSVVVTKVLEGAVSKFNDSSPEKAIRDGDRILSINGELGSKAKNILAQLQITGQLTLLMTRPHEE